MDEQCQAGQHDWAPIGVYVDGVVHVPCRRKHCKAELRQVWQLVDGPGTSVHGMELDIEDDPQGTVAKTICRETARQFPPDFPLAPGDVVIDIGAHVGVVSIYLAKRYPGIKVYAYEPVKANFERLMRNIEANKAEGITAINMAVTGNGRNVNLTGNASVNSGGANIYGVRGEGEPSISRSLAEVFAAHEIRRCKVLKLDCEGAEYEILQAAPSLLERVEYLRGEFHQSASQSLTPEALLKLCQRHIKPENIQVSISQM